jgi:hypothetical protein
MQWRWYPSQGSRHLEEMVRYVYAVHKAILPIPRHNAEEYVCFHLCNHLSHKLDQLEATISMTMKLMVLSIKNYNMQSCGSPGIAGSQMVYIGFKFK